MLKMFIRSTELSLLAVLCWAQASPGLNPAFQNQQPQPATQSQGTGELEGTVTDATGAVLPGATVTVKPAGGTPKVAVTDGAGKFRIDGLAPGPQEILVTAPGFAEFTSQSFNLIAGQANTLDVNLKVAAATTKVNVEAGRVTQIETENAEVSGTITQRQIVSYGLNGRNFSTLIALAPGVSNQTGQDEAKVGVLGSAKYSVNGGRTEYNTFNVDGNDVLNPDISAAHGHTTLLVYPSVDAVQELKVLTSNYGALYGRSASGTVLADIKSGASQFHGNAYEFVRNEAFNARNFFDQTTKSPLYRRNDFGGSIGGPLFIPHVYNTKKDKTFFFFSEEFRKERSPTQFSQGVPTDAERGYNLLDQSYTNIADFSDVCPVGGGTLNSKKFPDCPFTTPGLTLANSRFFIDPVATAFLQTGLIPRANSTTGCNSSIGSCYVATVSLPTEWREELLKIDHNFGAKTKMLISGVHDHWATTTSIPQWANQPNSFPTVLNSMQGPGVAAQAQVSTVISPTFLNVFSFGVTGQRIILQDIPGQGVTLSRAGLDAQQFPPGHLFNNGFGGKLPAIVIGGGNAAYGGAGFSVDTSFEPWSHSRGTISVGDNITKVFGKHTLQFGAQYVYAVRHEVNAANGPNTGDVQGVLTTRQGFSSNTFADFINAGFNQTGVPGFGPDPNAGGIQVFQQDSAQTTYKIHYWTVDPYVQDDWRITRRLVLNLGLRLSLFGNWQPEGRTLFNWQASAYNPALLSGSGLSVNISQGYLQVGPPIQGVLFGTPVPLDTNHLNPVLTNGLVQCGTNGVPASCQTSHLINPAPRVGFAWDPMGKGTTSIRGGYGIFYEHGTGSEANAGSLMGNPPQVLSAEEDGGPSQFKIGRYAFLPAGVEASYPLNMISIPSKTVWPYVQQWSFGIQHEIAKHTAATFSYVGSKGTHLAVAMQLNQLPPVPAANNPFGPHDPITADLCLQAQQTVSRPPQPVSFFVLPNGAVVRMSDNPSAFLGLLAACDPTPGAAGVPQLLFPLNLLRPFQGVGTITAIQNDAGSVYHAMQFTLRHNRGPLDLAVSYSYGHSIDSASDRYESNFVDSFNLGANRASSDFDERHILNVSYVYQLPLLRWARSFRPFVHCTDWDRKGGVDSCAKASPLPAYGGPAELTRILFSGWSISGITLFQTGTPFSVVNGANTSGFGKLDNAGLALGLGADSYPDIVSNPGCVPPGGPQTFGPLLGNTCMFAAPRGLTQGNAGRNSLNNPRRTNFNVALLRTVPLAGEAKFLQLRVEAFNLFNHTQFILYDPNKGNTASNTISCYGDQSTGFSAGAASCRVGNGFLHPVGAHAPRTMQFGLKLQF
jgi:hypothetical protein